MTIIVWDGKTLAADKASFSGNDKRKVTKIFKFDNLQFLIGGTTHNFYESLIGFAGHQSFCQDVIRSCWSNSLYPNSPFPDYKNYAYTDEDKDSPFCVIISKRYGLYTITITGSMCTYDDILFVMGAESCQSMAIGAMEAGADAQKAVEICIKRSTWCGLGVDTLTF